MRYLLVIALLWACKDKAAPPAVTAPVADAGYAARPVVVTDAAHVVACGPTTCTVYCVVTRATGGADEDPPRREEPTYACADAAPASGPGIDCSAPTDGVITCIEARKAADVPPRRTVVRAARVPCGPDSCAANEYCVTTMITGGARAVAERGRPPSYRCEKQVPDTTGAVECQPPQGRQVSCRMNAK